MKSMKRHFALEENEYLVTGESPEGKEYEVSYKGKKVANVVGLIVYAYAGTGELP